MIKTIVTALSAVAFAVTGVGYAADASAVPWPGWTDGQQIEARLLLAGVNRQFQPAIVRTAGQVCGILRADPTWDGKHAALDHLREAGYYEHQLGATLGTMVDVACPDMLGVIR